MSCVPLSMWVLIHLAVPIKAEFEKQVTIQGSDGRLKYAADAFGNIVPDFSMAGYRHGGIALPLAAVVETLNPLADSQDDSTRIQAAIDRAAKLPDRPTDGVCGAVLLTRGIYRSGKSLLVPAGVTLRGEGQDANGSVILATMRPSKSGGGPTLISMTGSARLQVDKTPHAVLDAAVPLGAQQMRVAGADSFKVGDQVIIERTATPSWIHDLKMDQIPDLEAGDKQWSPQDYTLRWQSRVAGVKGDALTLDTPVMCALESRYGGGSVFKCSSDPRGRAAAVERLRLDSVYESDQPNQDESHAWTAIAMKGLVDSWVREVTALHFAYACVNVSRDCARVTVEDCAMLDPVSQLIGGRRYSFAAGGQYVLFQRCYARNGRHDFVTGATDLGPTVFLDCLAEKTHADIGPHQRWACGQLYDNVKGGKMGVQDRGKMGSGHGWAGNCQVFWNGESTSLVCQRAWIPSTQNWAIGCVGTKAAPERDVRMDGCWESFGQHVAPRSLYLAQLKERFERGGGNGDEAIRAITTPEQRQGDLWKSLRRRFSQN